MFVQRAGLVTLLVGFLVGQRRSTVKDMFVQGGGLVTILVGFWVGQRRSAVKDMKIVQGGWSGGDPGRLLGTSAADRL